MEVVKHTKQSLHIVGQSRQSLWSLLLAIPCLAIVPGMTLDTVKIVKLECQRPDSTQITCQRTVTGILSTTTDSIPGQLQIATVANSRGTGVLLGTTNGKVPLAPHRLWMNSHHYEAIDRLNAFIQDPQQTTVRVEQDDRLASFLFVIFFLLLILPISINSLRIPLKMICKFDRHSNQVNITKKYWYGKRQIILPLSTIQQAHVDGWFCYLRVNKRSAYSLDLIQINGQKVSLTVPIQNIDQCNKIAYAINIFLLQ